MIRWWRNLHLLVGLAVTPFALMYGVSALQMAHPDWIPAASTETRRSVVVSLSGDDPAAWAATVREQAGLRGALSSVRRTSEGVEFRVVRPGTTAEVRLDPVAGRAEVSERVAGFAGLLTATHHLSGWHAHLPTALLALTLTGVSVGMVVLGISGLFLGYKLLAERRMGWIVLLLGLAYGAGLLAAVRLA